jgi:hypothetical protein
MKPTQQQQPQEPMRILQDKSPKHAPKKMLPSDKILLREEFQKTFEQVFEVMCFSLIKDATRGRIDLNCPPRKNNNLNPYMGDASIVSRETDSKERMGGTGVKKLYGVRSSNNNSRIEDNRGDRLGIDGGQSVTNKLQTFDFADNANN